MLKDPSAFEDIDIRRRDRLATERVTELLKKRCTSCGQRFDCSVYASACANGSRQGVHLNTYICNINKNQQKIINGKSALLSTDCALRYARTMSHVDGNGLTTEDTSGALGRTSGVGTLKGLESPGYIRHRFDASPHANWPSKGAGRNICARAATRHPGLG